DLDADLRVAGAEGLQLGELLLELLRGAEHADVVAHGLTHVAADPGDAIAVQRPVEDLADHLAVLLDHALRHGPGLLLARPGDGVLGGAPPEDERVEERVRADTVRAVDADAGGLARRIEAGHRRA